ncbi:hypothetical protein [Phascolarctobacterium sp.]|uniref:hypothetical protein n=1 Tax=Phascolarctobacterium sp. TaxID=2049039 RepID=UPI0026DB4988|nr:hypothetical protein [Phascolarctobacterium sp.]
MVDVVFCEAMLPHGSAFLIIFFRPRKKMQERGKLLKSLTNLRFFARTKKLGKKCFKRQSSSFVSEPCNAIVG